MESNINRRNEVCIELQCKFTGEMNVCFADDSANIYHSYRMLTLWIDNYKENLKAS